MPIGSPRQFRYRTPVPGEGEPLPDAGDFMLSARAAYRLVAAKLTSDRVEPWCNGGHPDEPGGIPEGMECRVLRFRLDVVRVDPAEVPDDAMVWHTKGDRRHHRH